MARGVGQAGEQLAFAQARQNTSHLAAMRLVASIICSSLFHRVGRGFGSKVTVTPCALAASTRRITVA